jgi:phosphatidylserine/phosphatidylglycerophosphate/cardiolipin synthase-like enzyme
VLLDLPQPDRRWADYVLGRRVVDDMRTRNQWEAEIDLLRRLHAQPSRERLEMAATLQAAAVPLPSVANWFRVREAFMSGSGDRLLLRNGGLLSGQWMGGQPSRHQWRLPDGQIRWIDKTTVALLWRDSPGAAQTRRLADASSAPMSKTVFLPQSTFGSDLLQGVKNARMSILVATYNMSEGLYGLLGEFYDVLRQKAQEGVEVVFVTEFGPGTSAFLKRSVLNFASTLATGGIQVRFMQQYKVMHKKLVVVDGETVWMGSANLTTAGLSVSNEANVRVQDPEVARLAEEDVRRLIPLAKTLSELKY